MPLTCFYGSLGSGKSYSMTDLARRTMVKTAGQVFTDMTSLRFPEQSYVHIEDMGDLAAMENGQLLLDEAQIGLASAKWQKVPEDALKALAQFRKNALDVLYTTQHPDRVVKVLRENTHNWVRCRRAGPVIVQTWREDLAQKSGRVKIVPIRSSTYSLYDTLEVLGSRTDKRLARSKTLDALRKSRSGDGARRAPLPWERPIWHTTEDGQSLTADASEVLKDLLAVGRVGMAHPCLWAYVRAETERRRWLSMFGLKSRDVGPGCTVDHPWTYGGCPCHCDPITTPPPAPPPFTCFEREGGAVNPEAATRRVGLRSKGFTAGDARSTLTLGGELVADRLGLFQVGGRK